MARFTVRRKWAELEKTWQRQKRKALVPCRRESKALPSYSDSWVRIESKHGWWWSDDTKLLASDSLGDWQDMERRRGGRRRGRSDARYAARTSRGPSLVMPGVVVSICLSPKGLVLAGLRWSSCLH